MGKLYLGIAREIITPPVGTRLYGYEPDVFSESVNDDLTATAFYLEKDGKKALMMSLTVCEINTALCCELREKISRVTGIDKENIMLCATHTHSAPNVAGTEGWGSIDEEYCNGIFVPRILSCVEKALSETVAVKVSSCFGNSYVGVNRRQLQHDNSIDFGQNIWGCFNPKMTIVSFTDESGKPVANMVHYGCHGTAAGMNHEITRDWSGIMTDALEKKSGAITAFFNGTMGDAGPRISNGKTTGDISYVYELGEIAARDVLEIYDKMKEPCEAEFSVLSKTLMIPLKPRMSLEMAAEMYPQYKNQTVNIGAHIRNYLENVMKLERENIPGKEFFEIEQTTVALGDVVFTGIPFEMFAETGFRIDGAFGDKQILCVSNTNGFEGYFVTEDAICRGGYEVDMFLYGRPQQFCDNADWYLMKQMTENVGKLFDIGE